MAEFTATITVTMVATVKAKNDEAANEKFDVIVQALHEIVETGKWKGAKQVSEIEVSFDDVEEV